MNLINNIRWNITHHARIYEAADSYFVSVTKSGRTWVRFFLQTYFCAYDKREFSLKVDRFTNSTIPNVLFTHDLYEHATEHSVMARFTGKQLIPRNMRYEKPVLLLVRDPRDVVVSLYFQNTKREKRSKHFKGTISEMLRNPVLGIDAVVWAMNTWLDEWSNYPRFRMFRYEDIRADPAGRFREMLLFLGLPSVDDVLLRQGIESARFENMQKLESQGGLESGIMRPGDPRDPESFKVRRGLVGGYKEYLNPDDVAFLEQALRSLNPRFGY